eukprot:830342-Prorocentrum_lima.AAC.1
MPPRSAVLVPASSLPVLVAAALLLPRGLPVAFLAEPSLQPLAWNIPQAFARASALFPRWVPQASEARPSSR